MRKSKVKKEVVWSVVIAIIMVSSVFGVMLGSFVGNNGKIEYNGLSFALTDLGYKAKINSKEMFFSYSPYDAESIPVGQGVISKIASAKMVHITYNSSSPLREGMAQAQFSLSNDLYNLFRIYAPPSMAQQNQYNIPVITCQNATSFVPVISFGEANETSISISNHCISLKAGSGNEFLFLKDRLIYGLAGIIR